MTTLTPEMLSALFGQIGKSLMDDRRELRETIPMTTSTMPDHSIFVRDVPYTDFVVQDRPVKAEPLNMFGFDIRSEPLLPEIIVNDEICEFVEDWSGCRSPSRARRRRAQGHRQRVTYKMVPQCVQIGGNFYMHSRMYQALQDRLSADMRKAMEGAVHGD